MLMKQSIKTKKQNYNEWLLAQKKSKALNLLGSVASWSLREDSVEILSDEEEKGNIKYLSKIDIHYQVYKK